ncbi:MAG TPA: hypothetical protein VMV31_11135 [Terriglobales bacterium]|nr:hypothetical protein [Terriglobales bacterium]
MSVLLDPGPTRFRRICVLYDGNDRHAVGMPPERALDRVLQGPAGSSSSNRRISAGRR